MFFKIRKYKIKKRYYRYLIYNEMLHWYFAICDKRRTGLCTLFEYSSSHLGILTDYIDELPELKQACKNHPKFNGFLKFYWFDNNSNQSIKEWNKVREEVLVEAINLTYKKSLWTKWIGYALSVIR